MRLDKLFEAFEDDFNDEMTVGDGLRMLAELADGGDLGEDELEVIDDMFEYLDGDEDGDGRNRPWRV